MAREFFNVRNDQGCCVLPGTAADATTFFYAGAGDGPLEWSEYEFIAFDEVETYP